MSPTIKKVAKNGQICLPPRFRDQQVVVQDNNGYLTIELLHWDNDLEIFISDQDAQDFDGEVVYGVRHDDQGLSLAEFEECLQKA